LDEETMTNDLAIPAFLDRKKNGIVSGPLPKERAPRKRKATKQPNTIRVYLRNRIRGLSCGWHDVELVHLGRKHVRFRGAGKTQCVRVSRSVWDAIQKQAT
jgi:hypothetical protein